MLTSRPIKRSIGFDSPIVRLNGPMVKRTSSLASTEVFRVRVLVGLLTTRPASVLDRTADFDSARRGSIPRRAAAKEVVLGVCRIARDSAKVEDQVRFLARTLSRRWSQAARQPAAGTDRRLVQSKWVRLPPASLTVQLPVQTTSRKCKTSEPFLRWMVLHYYPTDQDKGEAPLFCGELGGLGKALVT